MSSARALPLLLLISCVDPQVEIPARATGVPALHLSQLGLFAGDLAAQMPNPGIVPYTVVAPLYSDGAHKHRFVWLPEGQQARFQTDRWSLPAGTLLIKTFYFPEDERDPTSAVHLLETRVLLVTSGDIKKATYVWNSSQDDATASGGNLDIAVHYVDATGQAHDQMHHVPGTDQCDSCHGAGAHSLALGWRTRQMNVEQPHADGTTNQIDHLVATGMLDGASATREQLVDPLGTAPLDARARSYLDANCSHCHMAGGLAGGTKLFWAYELVDQAFCRPTRSVDGRSRVIVPGHAGQSELLTRMRSSDPYVRMPLGPLHVPDAAGISMLNQWTDTLSPAGCPQ